MARVEPQGASVTPTVTPSSHRQISFRTKFRLLLLVVLIGAIGFAALRSGWWQPPVLSALFYEEPRPIRTVEPTNNQEISLQLSLDRTARAVFREQDLTALARADEQFPLKDPTIVVTPKNIQVVGSVPWSPRLKVVAFVVPSVEEGELRMEISSAQLGQLGVPAPLLGISSRAFTLLVLSPIPDFTSVERVELEEGVVRMTLQL